LNNTKKIYFASDFHLGVPTYEKSLEREKKIVAWLNHIEATALEIFLVGDIHLNRNYTHNKCSEIMNTTEKELNDKQLWSGLVGFKSDGKYSNIIKEGWEYSQIEGCIDGFEQDHRHDQSVLSILSSRYDISTQNIDIYGYWTDINRNLQRALEINSVIFLKHKLIFSATTFFLFFVLILTFSRL
jgi:hypothetical protein